jgi:sodium/potassium-transporting ATPase subunit alpha
MDLLGYALLAVALLNGAFSFFQEYRAERAMEELRKYLPHQVEVVRDGRPARVSAETLVPGDVVALAEGDRLSADLRLVEGTVVVNNAPLTGEARPLTLSAVPSDSDFGEAENLAFAGCTVMRGRALGVVFATGVRSEFGKIAHLSQAIRRTPAPLERETAHMMRVLTVIAVSMGLAFFLYGVASGRPLWVNLVFMMGIIVANVPEGLLPTLTLALAMGSLRMARKNVLITTLNAVETLGAVHVICTDKTGTLTENHLSLTHLSDLDGQPLAAEQGLRLLDLALIASEVRAGEKGWSGDPLDVAIAEKRSTSGDESVVTPTGAVRFAFDVDKRRAAGCGPYGGAETFVVKGAWEALRPLLRGVEDGRGGVLPADAATLDRAEATMQRLAAGGLRIIAVAGRPLPATETVGEDQAAQEHDLVFAGFLGVEDPLRPEIPTAVARCHAAGIDVILITGDHPGTALAVARNSGILPADSGAAAQLTGAELERLNEEELTQRLAAGVRLFARTTPEQKMKIVLALKRMDKVVAMTGDGVNDAPALKAADVGIAMGKSGTDVARAAAQVILLDDNFASIVAGVEEGRAVFANIRKFTTYVLASNVPEILPYLLFIVLPVPLALTVIQILFVDLGSDLLPAIALGQEPPEAESMRQPPRPPRAVRGSLLTPDLLITSYLFLGLIEALWSLFLFFLVLLAGGWHYGMELATSDPLYRSATGIALAAVLLAQAGNVIGRRHLVSSGLDRRLLANRLLLFGIATELVLSWALLYWPPLQHFLGTAPPPLSFYLLAWLGIPLMVILDLLRKRLVHARRPVAATG